MKLQLLIVAACGLAAFAGDAPSAMIQDQSDDSTVGGGALEIDPAAEKETEAVFEEALKEEAPALKVEEALEEKHPVKEHVQGATNDGSNTDKVSEFEKDVTDLVLGLGKGGFAATPMGGSVKKIKDVIEKEMLPAVKAAHGRIKTS